MYENIYIYISKTKAAGRRQARPSKGRKEQGTTGDKSTTPHEARALVSSSLTA